MPAFIDRMRGRALLPGGIAARAMARHGHNGTPDYLKGLNPEQRLAVETTGQCWYWPEPTGKTRNSHASPILQHRQAFPRGSCAVTFTNKARG